MSDLINKKPLLNSLVDWQMSSFAEVGHEREYNLLDSIIKGIENEPTVDAVEVVHCKACAKWGCGLPMETDSVKCCGVGGYMVGGNGYCVYGELWSRKKV